jgi:hypothetical protein
MDMELEALADRVAEGVGPRDVILEAEIYAALQRRRGDIEDAYPSERVPGKVVVRYDSGSHGTCGAPDYVSNIQDAARLMPDGWLVEVRQLPTTWYVTANDGTYEVGAGNELEARARTAAALRAMSCGVS